MTNRAQGSSSAPQRSYLMRSGLSSATVAAGTAPASQNIQPPSSGRHFVTQLGLLHTNSSSPTHSRQGSLEHLARMSHSVSDYDTRMDNGINIPGSWGKGGGGNYSSQNFHGYGSPGGLNNGGFLKPTYLRESKYMEKLEAAHKAKLAAQREAHSAHSSNPGSLSTSSSSVSLHKMAPSHRGMTYEIIEHQSPVDDDGLMPLPSKWAEADRHGGLEIGADGLDVKYVGIAKLPDHEAASARADHPMPPQCGIYYFEVTIVSKGKDGMIGVGFSGAKASLEKFPGWELESWAYHGDDGKSFCCQSIGKPYGPTFTTGDIIGCGVNFMTGCAFFTKNGNCQGPAFKDLKGVNLYPSVGMKRPLAHLSVNFGQKPFTFDIDGMMANEKADIGKEINSVDVSKLYPPLDENSLLKELVAQFLAHDGYVETRKAFAEEVLTEEDTLKSGRATTLDNYAVEEDTDAVNRQQIRTAILEGDIDIALKRTNAFYPHVLEQNPRTHFRLRCRKFVEMLRRSAELRDISVERRSRSLNGHNDDDFEPDMEMDETMHNADDWDRMDTEDSDHQGHKHQDLLDETVKYGQELKYDYKDDHSKYVRYALNEIFSMFAYEDPRKGTTSHLIDKSGRVPVAEELNSAILVSLGKSSSAAIERLYQQTEVLVNDISEEGGPGAFINVRNDFLR